MDTVYAIFDNVGDCVYLCYAYADEEFEYHDQIEPMSDNDWEDWLENNGE